MDPHSNGTFTQQWHLAFVSHMEPYDPWRGFKETPLVSFFQSQLPLLHGITAAELLLHQEVLHLRGQRERSSQGW